jgi:hypothetical protein
MCLIPKIMRKTSMFEAHQLLSTRSYVELRFPLISELCPIAELNYLKCISSPVRPHLYHANPHDPCFSHEAKASLQKL